MKNNPFIFGKKCIGTIICTPEFRIWFQAHQGVFLLYPFGPLHGGYAEYAFHYFVFTYV